LQEFIDECLSSCYENSTSEKQMNVLKWLINIFLVENEFDRDCWLNVRVVVVDHILKKAIALTKQEVLIQFFQEQAENLLNEYIKIPINANTVSVEKLVLHM
jgi:uncharacterized NAD(P)/FAD-binding protein YdhS